MMNFNLFMLILVLIIVKICKGRSIGLEKIDKSATDDLFEGEGYIFYRSEEEKNNNKFSEMNDNGNGKDKDLTLGKGRVE